MAKKGAKSGFVRVNKMDESPNSNRLLLTLFHTVFFCEVSGVLNGASRPYSERKILQEIKTCLSACLHASS